MLRGTQTPGELKQRGQRLHEFASLAEVQATLDRLVEGGLIARHGRRPGQKEDRYEQLVGPSSESAPTPPNPEPARGTDAGTADPAVQPSAPQIAPAEDRLTRVEGELSELRAELADLRAALGD